MQINDKFIVYKFGLDAPGSSIGKSTILEWQELKVFHIFLGCIFFSKKLRNRMRILALLNLFIYLFLFKNFILPQKF